MTTFNSCVEPLEPASKPPPPSQPNSTTAISEDDRPLKIKKLKAKLINEEHRLVLMKKIRQSQTRPVASQQQAQINNSLSVGSNQFNSQSGQAIKKLRTSHQHLQPSNNLPLALQKNHLSSSASSPHGPTSTSSNVSLNQTPAHAHQRPKVNNLWNPPQQARHPTPAGIAPPHVGNLSRQPITTPPNVVQAMMGSLGQQSLLMNQINAAGSRRPQQQQQQQQSFNKSQAAQLLSQANKRTGFKPSIQKQLEQTLLQQQQQQTQQQQTPKHAQPGLNFSPNLSSKRASIGIQSPHVGNLNRQPITTPPNVVQDMRGNLSGQQSLLMNSANNLSGNRRPLQQPQQSTSMNKSQAAQMLLQKRTAAKSSIQKQLEQTLMQLPQKQVQLGIDFIPNANNIEFVYYIGLEACVDYLTGTKNPLDTQPLETPLECSTCGTDFTPAWSWKRSNAVCENCVSNHVKKSIKNSQASKIKSLLIKAAKQEQEMDQRIMAEAANVVSTSSPVTSTNHTQQQQHSLLQPVSQAQSRAHPQQYWPRVNQTSIANTVLASLSRQPAITTTTPSANSPVSIQPPAVNQNPLGALQPAALASLLQMNPQFSTLASLMTANSNANTTSVPIATNTTTTNNTNQFAQVAALLMNQLTMNLWKR